MEGRRATAVVVAVVIGLLLLAGPPLGCASASTQRYTAAVVPLSVAATGNYGFQPATFQQVPTNTTVNVTFTDESNLPHTFTIIGKQGWVVPSSYSSAQIDSLGYGDSPPALFNLNVSSSGDVVSGSFVSPGPGWYEFVCTVSGHFQNGMYGFIAFGVNLPSNLTSPNGNRIGLGGGFGSWVGAVSAVVVVLALIVTFVVWRRRATAARLDANRTRKP